MPYKKTKTTKSVETITAKLHDIVIELESHADNHRDLADAGNIRIAAAQDARNAHKAEHQLATTVAANIKALLGA